MIIGLRFDDHASDLFEQQGCPNKVVCDIGGIAREKGVRKGWQVTSVGCFGSLANRLAAGLVLSLPECADSQPSKKLYGSGSRTEHHCLGRPAPYRPCNSLDSNGRPAARDNILVMIAPNRSVLLSRWFGN
jgi:hypothetical protein